MVFDNLFLGNVFFIDSPTAERAGVLLSC
jgi:hypothetical protein